MPDTKLARLLAYVTGLVNQKLLLQNEYLIAENRMLRTHLAGRMRLSTKGPQATPSGRVSHSPLQITPEKRACVREHGGPHERIVAVSESGRAEFERLRRTRPACLDSAQRTSERAPRRIISRTWQERRNWLSLSAPNVHILHQPTICLRTRFRWIFNTTIAGRTATASVGCTAPSPGRTAPRRTAYWAARTARG